MTAYSGPVAGQAGHRGLAVRQFASGGRLLRLELRRSAMLWMLPVVGALFWYNAFRESMAEPAMWNLRAVTMQHGILLDFAPPVVGAAAWMGSRDGRRHLVDLIGTLPRPRWTAQLAAWAAVTCWALLAYCCCVAVVYGATAGQASWGGPLWWPAIVGAVGIPALSAVGFTAGAWFPSRFTVPIVTVGAFFALGFSGEAGGREWQVSPTVSGAPYIGPDSGTGTFYHYLPDLSIAQVICVTGVTLAAIGALGLLDRAGGPWRRNFASGLTAAGLIAVAVAAGLTGTARLDPQGMLIIPALHDAANNRPIRYTPVCDHSATPICLNPAYAAYLPDVREALAPVLSEIAGLPGAPARVDQLAPIFVGPQNSTFVEGGPGVVIARAAESGSRQLDLVLPDQLPGEPGTGVTATQFIGQIRLPAVGDLVKDIVGGAPGEQSRAQEAVAAALTFHAGASLAPRAAAAIGDGADELGALPAAVETAAGRFAALPAGVRHAWLAAHLTALRAGRITLEQIP
jgi:hypothetical protein